MAIPQNQKKSRRKHEEGMSKLVSDFDRGVEKLVSKRQKTKRENNKVPCLCIYDHATFHHFLKSSISTNK